MVITFYGEGCFKLQSGDFVILTDVFDNKTGLVAPRLKPDIILKTLTPLSSINNQELATQSQQPTVIIGPGEYNIKDINITGFLLAKESSEKFFKTIYLLEMEGIKLCFLGHLSEIPEPTILEHLEEIDILFVPAGGPPFLNQKLSVKIIKQLQPKIVVPCFFKIPSLKRPADKIEVFLEEFNGPKTKQTEAQEKLVVKKKDLADIKKTEVAVLKP
jgi:L-ascorbate metabolism protein UlaG (beta-lactamase superfamily)